MEKIQLTKREYLGTGNWYVYENQQGNKVSVPYNGTDLPQEIEGLTFTNVAFSGNSLLNTEDGLGKEGDYFIKDNVYHVYEITEPFWNLNEIKYTEEEFNSKFI